MNQVGRIKLMTKSLTSKECAELYKYFDKKRWEKLKQEHTDEVVAVGVGGRVVYSLSNRDFDVTGKIGTIKTITKRKGKTAFEVEFDEPVWTKKSKRYTKDYWKWYTDIPDKTAFVKKLYDEYVANGGKGTYWNMNNRLKHKEYTKQTGKEAKEEHTDQGKTLIRIPARALAPATEKNINSALHTREQMPMIRNINKIFQGMIED